MKVVIEQIATGMKIHTRKLVATTDEDFQVLSWEGEPITFPKSEYRVIRYLLVLENTVGCYAHDAQGNAWCTFQIMGNGTETCGECGATISGGWVRGKLFDEQFHVCSSHVHLEKQASRPYGVVRVVLEECVSYWMIRGEMETGYALDCTDRPKRKQAEVIAREWCEKYGFAGFETITLTMKQEVNQ